MSWYNKFVNNHHTVKECESNGNTYWIVETPKQTATWFKPVILRPAIEIIIASNCHWIKETDNGTNFYFNVQTGEKCEETPMCVEEIIKANKEFDQSEFQLNLASYNAQRSAFYQYLEKRRIGCLLTWQTVSVALSFDPRYSLFNNISKYDKSNIFNSYVNNHVKLLMEHNEAGKFEIKQKLFEYLDKIYEDFDEQDFHSFLARLSIVSLDIPNEFFCYGYNSLYKMFLEYINDLQVRRKKFNETLDVRNVKIVARYLNKAKLEKQLFTFQNFFKSRFTIDELIINFSSGKVARHGLNKIDLSFIKQLKMVWILVLDYCSQQMGVNKDTKFVDFIFTELPVNEFENFNNYFKLSTISLQMKNNLNHIENVYLEYNNKVIKETEQGQADVPKIIKDYSVCKLQVYKLLFLQPELTAYELFEIYFNDLDLEKDKKCTELLKRRVSYVLEDANNESTLEATEKNKVIKVSANLPM